MLNWEVCLSVVWFFMLIFVYLPWNESFLFLSSKFRGFYDCLKAQDFNVNKCKPKCICWYETFFLFLKFNIIFHWSTSNIANTSIKISLKLKTKYFNVNVNRMKSLVRLACNIYVFYKFKILFFCSTTYIKYLNCANSSTWELNVDKLALLQFYL